MKKLATLPDLREALSGSPGRLVLFKHSTRCPLSAEALEEFEQFARKHPQAAHYALIDLLTHREVSRAIEQELGVRHESPQAIVVDQGAVRAVLNHQAIRGEALGAILLPSSAGA